jgi:hypothetical protein
MDIKIYFSLDEARDEIKKRWNNVALKKKIEEELGNKFISNFKNNPRGITFRQLCSPDNGFTFFFQCAKYIDTDPMVLEYHDDIFVHLNEEKKGLGRLRVNLAKGIKAKADIMNFYENEKKKLGDCILKSGEKLTDFHQNLFKISGYEIDFLENSEWFHKIGNAQKYYYYLLLHFVAHGALFETFLDESDSNEDKFTHDIIMPSLKKIKEKFGISPLIIRLYSANQNDDEDFYWWSYPPYINNYLIDYVNNQKIEFKSIN